MESLGEEKEVIIWWCGAFGYIIMSSCLIAGFSTRKWCSEAKAFTFRVSLAARAPLPRWENSTTAWVIIFTCRHFTFIGHFLNLWNCIAMRKHAVLREWLFLRLVEASRRLFFAFRVDCDWLSTFTWLRLRHDSTRGFRDNFDCIIAA